MKSPRPASDAATGSQPVGGRYQRRDERGGAYKAKGEFGGEGNPPKGVDLVFDARGDTVVVVEVKATDPDYRKALPGHAEPLPADLIRTTGEALFGRDWVAPLARALGIAERTVHRWKADETRASPRLVPELLELLEERAQLNAQARRQLRRRRPADTPPRTRPPG